ncbi:MULTISPECIES: bifunctional aminoglycoside phosphotransferase/ATP-binding protein [unclassified Ensifer]|uniref:bifunctional aminoglycoside phosphotransferase/ATP-binding protein n=1 Tax=unclassified Ensifer TaxID=2633371 RepID=UPI00070BE432|nr:MULTISPECIES: bifunctional aminoglycoside phosphotransferase/ATP-binding protein [unclassified Ensifer]KQW51061.1 aminoglycoside phosphotransferase [Ensifer sp. Root1252]KRC54311.1 aminoglycoside phosphotransferase [Ensifer sp. Root231]KRD01645.1 aminoglycoside phosphotransferase [Ensifer sp. Root258]
MSAEDQSDVVRFLEELCGTNAVERIETHISYIFLIGDRAFKVKRAVKLPYVDFSTPRLRLEACKKEVVLNAVTAPGLYIGVRKIMRGKDGRLRFDEGVELVDATVEMVRFEQSRLFDRMAVDSRLTAELMTRAARMIARFHREAPIIHEGSGSENIAGVLRINAAGFATSRVFGSDELADFNQAFDQKLTVHAPLLDAREAAGKVRRCHGDLHLRNICLIDGEPRLFDCIEFNDQIATVDTLYDLAFLLMDLWHRGFPEFANLVANRYLDETDDDEGFVLLPYFMAIRAAVRAHVTATQVEESSAPTDKLAAEARSYFDLAGSLIVMKPVRLVAIGGLSGSGKTTVAEILAPQVGSPPGARIIESDRIRKAMHGVPAEEKLSPAAYRPEVSEKVYGEMARRTFAILRAGGSVVADAVFDRTPNRARIEAAARDAGVPCTAVWLDANASLLRRRVASRTASPSDADLEVLSRQLAADTKGNTWQRVDADRDANGIARAILELQSG